MNVNESAPTSQGSLAHRVAANADNVDLTSTAQHLPAASQTLSQGDIVTLSQRALQRVNASSASKQTFTDNEIKRQSGTGEKTDENTFSTWSRPHQDKAYTLDKLKTNWLAESERMVEKYYGLKAAGENTLEVKFNDNPDESYLASVSYFPHEDDSLSRATNQVLTLVTSKFPQGKDENGGYSPFYGDRTVAHEMVHAIMGQTMDMDVLGEWFKEGAAELIHGADERLQYQLAGHDGTLENGYNNEDMMSFSNDISFFDDWNGSSEHYAKGYLAVRFMHQDIVSNGGEGLKEVMTFLTDEKMLATGNATLDNALAYLAYQGKSSYSSEQAFQDAYQQQAFNYLNTVDLDNEDTGAIGGFDVDRGDVKSAESVVNNTTISSPKIPLKGYRTVLFPEAGSTYSAYS